MTWHHIHICTSTFYSVFCYTQRQCCRKCHFFFWWQILIFLVLFFIHLCVCDISLSLVAILEERVEDDWHNVETTPWICCKDLFIFMIWHISPSYHRILSLLLVSIFWLFFFINLPFCLIQFNMIRNCFESITRRFQHYRLCIWYSTLIYLYKEKAVTCNLLGCSFDFCSILAKRQNNILERCIFCEKL